MGQLTDVFQTKQQGDWLEKEDARFAACEFLHDQNRDGLVDPKMVPSLSVLVMLTSVLVSTGDPGASGGKGPIRDFSGALEGWQRPLS